jgi:hypothetical protein
MIIISIVGGIGNQMFQYALGYSMARERNTTLYLDTYKYNNKKYIYSDGFLLQKAFDIEANLTNENELFSTLGIFYKVRKFSHRPGVKKLLCNFYKEKNPFIYDENLHAIKKSKFYLEGYWQSYKYFEKHINELRDLFLPRFHSISDYHKKILENFLPINAVSIHVRRGDYVTNKIYSKIFHLTDMNYFKTSIELIRSRVKNPTFYIFSNDITWVKNQSIFQDMNLIDGSNLPPYNDYYLMSLCNHHIISNSTFSWWPAYLNNHPNKIVISPKKWSNFNSDLSDLIPPSWIQL